MRCPKAGISQSNGDKTSARDSVLTVLGLSRWIGGRLSRRRAKRRHPLDSLQWNFISAVSDSAARDTTHTSTARSILILSTATKRSPGRVAAGQRAHGSFSGWEKKKVLGDVCLGADPFERRPGPAISNHTLPRLRNLTSPQHRPIHPSSPKPRPCFAPRHANWRAARGYH